MSLNYKFKAHLEDRPIHKISVYMAKDRYILIGYDKKKTVFSVLHIRNNLPSNQSKETDLHFLMIEDEEVKNRNEIAEYIKVISGSAKFVCKAYAIMGFIQFLEGYYMMLITEAVSIAKIANQKLYRINYVSYIPLFDHSTLNVKENKYLQYLKTFDLTTGFYFSHTYDMTHTFQSNVVSMINDQSNKPQNTSYSTSKSEPIKTFNDIFMWNYNLILDFYKGIKNKRWVIGIMHGFLEQIKIQKLSLTYQIILIARRSRHHAGTRYLTRGMNSNGFVGNFVETEQIVIDLNRGALANPICSSFVQVRGSVPTYWFQETKVVSPKPPINVNLSFDIYFEATKKHFADLYSLYGPLLFVLNLVRKNESTKREQHLTEGYQQAIDAVNKSLPKDLKIVYYHQDMKALLKRDKEEFLTLTNSFAHISISKTDFFSAQLLPKEKDKKPIILTFQKGVVRSNCVDCLDRTNTFQQLVGEAALSLQIAKIYENKNSKIEPSSLLDDPVLKFFRGMYGRMGDYISLQYGGSIAHKTNLQSKSSNKGQLEFVTSIKRYYNNTFYDHNKQNAINLFLKIHKPLINPTPIWDVYNPIVLTPDFEFLRSQCASEKWWDNPLKKFHDTIIIHNNIELTNRALVQSSTMQSSSLKSDLNRFSDSSESLPQNFLDSKASSLLKYSETYAKSIQEASTQEKTEGTFSSALFVLKSAGAGVNDTQTTEEESNKLEDSKTEDEHSFTFTNFTRDHSNSYINISTGIRSPKKKTTWLKNYVNEIRNKSKTAIFDMKTAQTELSVFSEYNQRPGTMSSAVLDSSRSVFEDQDRLFYLSKKSKKIYNTVLVLDHKIDEIEDNNWLPGENHVNYRKETKVVGFAPEPVLISSEKHLFKHYCSIPGINTDTLFNDKEMTEELNEELELGYNYPEMEEEFSNYLNINDKFAVKETFLRKVKQYCKNRPEEENSQNIFVDDEDAYAHGQKGENQGAARMDLKNAQNLTSIKNMITTLYPNLQRPNITKI